MATLPVVVRRDRDSPAVYVPERHEQDHREDDHMELGGDFLQPDKTAVNTRLPTQARLRRHIHN